MSNLHNAMALENLYERAIEDDKKGLIDDDEINRIAFAHDPPPTRGNHGEGLKGSGPGILGFSPTL